MTTINFTNRIDLEADDYTLKLFQTQDRNLEFEYAMEPAVLAEFPKGAGIKVEAYLRNSEERFDFGTVDAPNFGRRSLKRFSADDDVLFRIKIIDCVDCPGLLRGVAVRIQPTKADNGGMTSLIGVKIDDLDGLVYRLEFPVDSGPVVVLDTSLDDRITQGMKAVFRANPFFRSLVFPSIVREILTRLYLVDRGEASGENDPAWATKWKEFASSRNPDPLPGFDPGDYSARVDWIETAVSNLGSELKGTNIFEQAIRERNG